MKTTKKIIAAALTIIAATTMGFAQTQTRNQAQGQKTQTQQAPREKNNAEWVEKMRAEKVAFLTGELNLTPEEAQTFWPVYNKVEAKRGEAMKAEMKAAMAINAAIKNGEGDYSKLLDEYINAKKNLEKVGLETLDELRKALGDEKTAKLIGADEKFRKMQLHKLNGQHGNRPEDGARPAGPRPDGMHQNGTRPSGQNGTRPGARSGAKAGEAQPLN